MNFLCHLNCQENDYPKVSSGPDQTCNVNKVVYSYSLLQDGREEHTGRKWFTTDIKHLTIVYVAEQTEELGEHIPS